MIFVEQHTEELQDTKNTSTEEVNKIKNNSIAGYNILLFNERPGVREALGLTVARNVRGIESRPGISCKCFIYITTHPP